MSINWFTDFNPGDLLLDAEEKVVVMERAVWDRVACYNGTLPTTPSPGRVYRREGPNKTSQASGPGNEVDTLYLVAIDPHDDRFCLHHPYEALLA